MYRCYYKLVKLVMCDVYVFVFVFFPLLRKIKTEPIQTIDRIIII